MVRSGSALEALTQPQGKKASTAAPSAPEFPAAYNLGLPHGVTPFMASTYYHENFAEEDQALYAKFDEERKQKLEDLDAQRKAKMEKYFSDMKNAWQPPLNSNLFEYPYSGVAPAPFLPYGQGGVPFALPSTSADKTGDGVLSTNEYAVAVAQGKLPAVPYGAYPGHLAPGPLAPAPYPGYSGFPGHPGAGYPGFAPGHMYPGFPDWEKELKDDSKDDSKDIASAVAARKLPPAPLGPYPGYSGLHGVAPVAPYGEYGGHAGYGYAGHPGYGYAGHPGWVAPAPTGPVVSAAQRIKNRGM